MQLADSLPVDDHPAPAEPLTLLACAVQPGVDPLGDDRALELRHGPENREDHVAKITN